MLLLNDFQLKLASRRLLDFNPRQVVALNFCPRTSLVNHCHHLIQENQRQSLFVHYVHVNQFIGFRLAVLRPSVLPRRKVDIRQRSWRRR